MANKFIVLTRGLAASGKSAWAKDVCNTYPDTHVRVSKDDIRTLHGLGFSKDNEKLTENIRDSIINEYIRAGKQYIIVDDTNLSNRHFVHIKERFADPNGYEIVYKDFDIDVDEAILRDAARGDKSVGKHVIMRMYRNFVLPKFRKEFAEKHFQMGSIVSNNKPKAIIVDIDGTLAIMHNRGPFEWSKVGEDHPVEVVFDLINLYALRRDHNNMPYHVIFVSGRDGSCREDTLHWLNQFMPYEIKDDELYMRPVDNMEADNIIKQRVLDELKDKYQILFAIDDRKKVVKMWRDNGIFCFDVNQSGLEF